ncbi:hypothetical protein Tco_0192860, partial [Tanacetum coccineum]
SRYIVTPAGMETTSRNQVTSGRDQPISNIKLNTAETGYYQQKDKSASRKSHPTVETMQTAGIIHLISRNESTSRSMPTSMYTESTA